MPTLGRFRRGTGSCARSAVFTFATTIALCTCRPDTAPALDIGVRGIGLSIRTTTTGAKLLFKSTGHDISTGTIWTSGDPRCVAVFGSGAGGILRVNGGPGNDFTIALPCEGWTARESPIFNDIHYAADYDYRDPTGATCTQVSMRHGKSIKVVCKGPQVAYTLGAPQGNIDITIRTGALPERSCARFGPPPTVVTRDGSRGQYRARNAPGPRNPECPSSPSGAFID